MTKQSANGKQAWARRADSYCEDLRAKIEAEAAAAWSAPGGPPLWLRLKARLLAVRHRLSAAVRR